MQDQLETTAPAFVDGDDRVLAGTVKQTWRKPEITIFFPTSETEGIFGIKPGDGGFSNVC